MSVHRDQYVSEWTLLLLLTQNIKRSNLSMNGVLAHSFFIDTQNDCTKDLWVIMTSQQMSSHAAALAIWIIKHILTKVVNVSGASSLYILFL